MESVGVLHFVRFSTSATVLPIFHTAHNFFFDNPYGIWLCRAIISHIATQLYHGTPSATAFALHHGDNGVPEFGRRRARIGVIEDAPKEERLDRDA